MIYSDLAAHGTAITGRYRHRPYGRAYSEKTTSETSNGNIIINNSAGRDWRGSGCRRRPAGRAAAASGAPGNVINATSMAPTADVPVGGWVLDYVVGCVGAQSLACTAYSSFTHLIHSRSLEFRPKPLVALGAVRRLGCFR